MMTARTLPEVFQRFFDTQAIGGLLLLIFGTAPGGAARLLMSWGIGFTMSLVVAMLAFDDASLLDSAKFGILAASICAAVIAAVILSLGRVASTDSSGSV